MGFVKEQAFVMDEESTRVAVEAAAIRPCPIHTEVLINQGDPEADRRAYAMGTNLWKEGGIPCERTEFMDAIKDAIEMSAEECGACAKVMAD